LIPTSYFWIVPAYIQHRVDLIGTPGYDVRIYQIALGEMNSDSIAFTANVHMDALAPLPAKVGFNSFTTRLVVDGQEIGQLQIPKTEFWTNEELKIVVNGKFFVSRENIANTKNLIKRFSTSDGLKGLEINSLFALPITVFGWTIYSGLPLHRNILVGDVAGNVESLLTLINTPSETPSAIYFIGPETEPGAQLRANFNSQDIMQMPDTLGSFEIIWDRLYFKIDDVSFFIGLTVAFENPTPIELLEIDSIDCYFEVEDIKIAKLGVRNLGLSSGLNKAFDIELGVTFIDSMIDIGQIQGSLEAAASNFARTFNFNYSISGPIKVSRADFVEDITEHLKVTGTLQDILALVPSSVLNILEKPVEGIFSEENVETAANILGSSKISLKILSEEISLSLNLDVPLYDLIKPPKEISFPYESSISLYGGTVKALQIDAEPVTIIRDRDGLNVTTGVTIVPVNSDAASIALATSLNPILALNPTVGNIGIKDLAFRIPGKSNFRWCDALFGTRVISLDLPPINKEELLALAFSPKSASIVNSVMRDVSGLIHHGSVDIVQLNDQPGFGASGNLAIQYPENFPEVEINLGYFQIDTTVESVKLARLELPTGLQFFPSEKGSVINAAIVLSRDPKFAPIMQTLINALLGSSDQLTYLGVTGLGFGASQDTYFTTFERIVVDVGVDTILNILNRLAPDADMLTFTALLPKGLLKINSADLSIDSATEISLITGTTVRNPFPVTFSIGTLAFSVLLDKSRLALVNISPIDIGKGQSTLTVTVGLNIATGDNGMAERVASVVNAVLSKDFSLEMPIGITDTVLTPVRAFTPDAVIDQLRPVQIQFPIGRLMNFGLGLISSGSALGIIDSTALIVGDYQTVLSRINPRINFVQLIAQMGTVLNTGIDISYINPLPISLAVPYISVSVSVNGILLADTQVSGVQITRERGKHFCSY
jgi:hypothetical protein